jgi:hypothetical protein
MGNIKKENIAEGFLYIGLGLAVIGFFVLCASFALDFNPAVSFVMMIGGLAILFGTCAYIAFKGWF